MVPGHPIVLRPSSEDAVAARLDAPASTSWPRISTHHQLGAAVSRVVLDVTSSPPATISGSDIAPQAERAD